MGGAPVQNVYSLSHVKKRRAAVIASKFVFLRSFFCFLFACVTISLNAEWYVDAWEPALHRL